MLVDEDELFDLLKVSVVFVWRPVLLRSTQNHQCLATHSIINLNDKWLIDYELNTFTLQTNSSQFKNLKT